MQLDQHLLGARHRAGESDRAYSEMLGTPEAENLEGTPERPPLTSAR